MKPIGSSALIKRAEANVKDGRVDVVKLANQLGIDVFAFAKNDPDFNANIKYVADRNQFEIYVNSRHPSTRQRFSIAHELSHYALEPDEIITKGSLDRPRASLADNEREADALAAQILMPDSEIDKYFQSHGIKQTDDFNATDAEEIAAYFYVSRAMAVLRLREKGCRVPYLSFA